jgi:polynucleotide 5'-hydroxyl-kinase GRC3/NOL9
MNSIKAENYPEWQPLIEGLVDFEGVVAVIGAIDTGKTTLCSLLVNTLLKPGIPIGVVDCDVGQSEIGPPGAIGMGLTEEPIESIGDIEVRGLHFIGATSPSRRPLTAVAGAKRMVECAQEAGAKTIVMDTSGFVYGGAARYLILSKLELIRPKHVVLLQRQSELEPLATALVRNNIWKLHYAAIPSVITRKPPTFRVQRRRARLNLYFQNARSHTLSLDSVSLIGSRLGSGHPLSPDHHRLAEEICRVPILAAEEVDGVLHLVSSHELNGLVISTLQEQFHIRNVFVIDPNSLTNLAVGLTDHEGKTYAMGIIEKVDFRARMLHILTPAHSVTSVKWVHMGLMRIAADGSELGEIKPWQV